MNERTLTVRHLIVFVSFTLILLSLFFYLHNAIFILIILFLLTSSIIYGLLHLAEKIDFSLFGIGFTIKDIPYNFKIFICILLGAITTIFLNSKLNQYHAHISLDTTCKNINEKNTTLLINGNKVISDYKILNIPSPAFHVIVPRDGCKPREIHAKVFIEHPCSCYQEGSSYINIDIGNTIMPKKVSVNLTDSVDKKGDCEKLKDSIKDIITDIQICLNLEAFERCRELAVALENKTDIYGCDFRCDGLSKEMKNLIQDAIKDTNIISGFK